MPRFALPYDRLFAPTGGVELDRSHPLTTGLVSCVLLGSGADLVRRLSVVPSGAIPKAGLGGSGLWFNHTGDYASMSSAGLPTTIGTSLTVASSDVGYAAMAAPYTIHDSDTLRNYAGFVTAGGKRLEVFNDGRDSYYNLLTFNAGDVLAIVAAWNKAATFQAGYQNGRPLVLNIASGTWGSNTLGANYTIAGTAAHAANVGWAGTIYLQAFWNRVLSQAEISAVSSAPYQLLRPVPRRIHFILPTPPNQPPVVEAGTNTLLKMSLPASTVLAGSATDDGLPRSPGAVTCLWTVISQPAGSTVTFLDDTSPVSPVAFDREGIYVLRLTASDSVLSAFDDVVFGVSEGGSVVVAAGQMFPRAA